MAGRAGKVRGAGRRMPSKTGSFFEGQAGVIGPAPIDEIGTAVSRRGPDQLRDRVDDATEFTVHGVGDHLSPNSAPSKAPLVCSSVTMTPRPPLRMISAPPRSRGRARAS